MSAEDYITIKRVLIRIIDIASVREGSRQSKLKIR